ncbi:LysR family transcriptional regulator [Brevibacterium zhoupengii]|uniref:LysR family transcriptional regulator n=1 Tax=Brevibacterium zhoupengii TaxID=2898795 RepID=UPI001F08EF4A|nr:LysR family transcriptional regulator [Brevibacterium zhoupengii]
MSEVSLKQLRCFLAVYAERSFTKAAKSLHMAQSPVSQAVASLERHLGERLFERGNREVTPTAAARGLYPEALELRRRAESLPQLIAETRDGTKTQRIRIGGVSSTFPAIMAGALEALASYSVIVSDGNSSDLTRAVDNGDIDVCLIREFSSHRADERIVLRERLCVAMPDNHRLSGKSAVSVDDIAAEPIVLFRRTAAPVAFDLVASVFIEAGRTMTTSAQVSNEQAILGLVAAETGISLVPESVGSQPWKGVTFAPLAGAKNTYPLTIRTAPGDPLGLLSTLTDALRSWASGHELANW